VWQVLLKEWWVVTRRLIDIESLADWTDVYPAWPLLQRLGAGRAMGELIYCVDGVKEAADLLTAGLNAAGSRK